VNVFVFGLGYSALHYVTTRLTGQRVVGTVRNRETARAIGAAYSGTQALIFGAPTIDAAIGERLASTTHLLVSIPPGESDDPVLAHFADAIAVASDLKRIVYLSTIGVYGDHGGAWIDEEAPTEPNSARNRARVGAEREWIALGERAGKKISIIRLAGIYGPGRNSLVNLREGKARRIVKPGQVFNRIHVEDIARAIAAAFAPHAPSGIFNVTDDEPAPPQDVIAYAAELLGIEPSPQIDFDGADLTPMVRSFYSSNKRVSNRRMKQQLGVTLAYPTYREGLRALAARFTEEPRRSTVGAGPRIS
jgi:nucleoside-diphosphate-sugar epimerase